MKKMQSITPFLFGALLLLGACKGKTQEEAPAEETAQSGPDIRMYVLDGGSVQVNNLELFSQDTTYRGQTAQFADAYYVIVHPKGTLMWDAGLSEQLVGMPEPYTSPDGNFSVSRPDSLVNQLKAIGMTPEDIDFLSLSHTHFDHSGHAEALPQATWLVQEVEYDWVLSPEVEAAQPDMFNAVNDIQNIKKIKGDYDVFGDGSVQIKYMPGHTPGHSVLHVDPPDAGPILLSGDLYHLELNRVNKRVPIFNYDVKLTLESMEAFEAYAESVGARVVLQHSKDDFDNMPKAPEYLK